MTNLKSLQNFIENWTGKGYEKGESQPSDDGNEQLKKEMELSIKAGELVGKIYDAILPQYSNPESPETLQSLN